MRPFNHLYSWLMPLMTLLLSCSADRSDRIASNGYSAPGVSTTPIDAQGNPLADGSAGGPGAGGAVSGAGTPTISSGDCETAAGTTDLDLDGFSPADGDCNECSPQINPGAFDFPENGHDEDCVGGDASQAELDCDQGLSATSSDPEDAARAMGLCKFTTEQSGQWGVISARFTRASGGGSIESPTMVGVPPRFGAVEPRQGGSVLVISTGVARDYTQPGFTDSCDDFGGGGFLGLGGNTGMAPAGYPKESSSCSGGGGSPGGILIGNPVFGSDSVVYNDVALHLRLRVPTNANSFAFDSMFYTYEYPDFICSAFNDFFVVMKTPTPAGVPDGNILFDQNGDPVGVNNALLDVCVPQTAGGKSFPCSQGTGLLAQTGFGSGESSCAEEGAGVSGQPGASTGWLNTTAPADAGEVIEVRFILWDTNDAILDSTSVIDNFRWSVDEPQVETTAIII